MDTIQTTDYTAIWQFMSKEGRGAPSVCVSEFRAPKVLYCIFFDGLGHVVQIPVPKGQTLTGQFTQMWCCLRSKNFILSFVQGLELVVSKFCTIMLDRIRIGSALIGQFSDTLKSYPRMSIGRPLKIAKFSCRV